jgi:hypothetical protein
MAGGRFDIRSSVRDLENAYRRLAGSAARPRAGRGRGDHVIQVAAR